MKTIDMRFNADMIQEWVGEKFVKYKCDPFNITNSVTQIVGLYIGDDIYSLTNIQEAVDYFGFTLIRSGPGTNYSRTGRFTGIGVFTIVAVSSGDGSSSGWGKLKSGAGWISLDFCTRI